MNVHFDTRDIDSYRLFCKIKRLPTYQLTGHVATFPDEYAAKLGLQGITNEEIGYEPHPDVFDYQRDIVRICLRKRKFAIFADCGLGKTIMFLEWIKALGTVLNGKSALIISPLMVIPQTIAESRKWFYEDLPIQQVRAAELVRWLKSPTSQIGITNYDALTQDGLTNRNLGALVLDESSMLKSHYGKWASQCLALGQGLEWKLACTGTPAPNDRIEYANHAVYCDAFSSINGFLATFFVNRGQTQERWVLKDHALESFYRALSHWCIFLTRPEIYGWKDNTQPLPPIVIHEHDIALTKEQQSIFTSETGELFANRMGGIRTRGKLGQLAKGHHNGKEVSTNKPAAIRRLIQQWPDESTIVWCIYNREQDQLAKEIPEAASISGATPIGQRLELIEEFKAGIRRILITKPKILGFGLNLQIATRQVFAGLQDCYDDMTEVLTRNGWKTFGDCDMDDQLATCNPTTLQFEWQWPTEIIWSEYMGPMIQFGGQRGFDLLVTPNHRMFVCRCPIRYRLANRAWHFRYANELCENYRRQEYRMLSCSQLWRGDSPEVIVNTCESGRSRWATVKTVHEMATEDAVRLAGWYVTEGHCRLPTTAEFGRIVICQSDGNPSNRAEIIDLLSRLFGSVNTNTKDLTSYCRHVAHWLLSEFGHGSHNKRLPRWIKDLDARYLCILRDVMMKGDGGATGRYYRTASRQLADDFQEVAIKTGIRASVKPRICKGSTLYDVVLEYEHTQPSISSTPSVVSYEGMIGCARVMNGTLIVRRNGIPVVSGNSYESFYQAVKRSNRYGAVKSLNVHIPMTDLERPMVENVLRKAKRIDEDTRAQERYFRRASKELASW